MTRVSRRGPKTTGRRTDLRVLTVQQEDELTSWWGRFSDTGSYFASDEEAREAWSIHGDRIMSKWDTPYKRPRGWWLFTQNEDPPASGERERLHELGELTAQELTWISEHHSGGLERASV